MNNLNNFIAKLCAFNEDSGRKFRANVTRHKAISGVCLTFGVQNLNLQQEKALGEFLSGSDVFVNLPTGYGKSLIYHFQSSTAISKQKHSLKPCSSPLVKIIILLSICVASSLNTLALNTP